LKTARTTRDMDLALKRLPEPSASWERRVFQSMTSERGQLRYKGGGDFVVVNDFLWTVSLLLVLLPAP
jgi:hypothetical protein